MTSSKTRTHAADGAEEQALPLVLAVVGPRGASTHPLPSSGAVVVGRDPGAEVQIDDDRISRRHVVFHLGAAVYVEDLGSRNGTRVAGARLAPAERRALLQGESVEVGPYVLVVQRSAGAPAPALSHALFEARLVAQCEQGQPFCVAMTQAARSQLQPALPEEAVLAQYGPGCLEVILTHPAAAQRWADAVRAGAGLQLALCQFPEDGRTADALIATLRARLLGPPHQPAGPAPARSAAMKKVYEQLAKAAAGKINVLILGETGVGKDVIARELHRLSARRQRPFVSINCAAISETLLESELFGHEKGAFTGAAASKPGLLETAEGGSVFLDEVGELPLATQAKLLQVLERKEVLRVGGLKPRPIDVRFVAATLRDLEQGARAGKFREDLYFRLAGFTLEVPPLRARREEVLPLAEHFLGLAAAEQGLGRLTLTPDAARLLEQYSWPGNIRELRNVVERAALLSSGGRITREELPVEKLKAYLEAPSIENPVPDSGPPPGLTADQLDDRKRILDALTACAGNQSDAAKKLGIARSTFVVRLDLYRIPRPRKK